MNLRCFPAYHSIPTWQTRVSTNHDKPLAANCFYNKLSRYTKKSLPITVPPLLS